MQEATTHYDILGISPEVNQDKIHRAYSSLLAEAREKPDSPEHRAFMAKAKMAYQVLSRPESRAAYHRELQMAAPELRKWHAPKDDQLHPALYMGFFAFLLGCRGSLWPGCTPGSRARTAATTRLALPLGVRTCRGRFETCPYGT